MKRTLLTLTLAACALLAGCATGPLATPEASIAAGANAHAAATTLATVALRNEKITVAQAKSYRAVLGAAASTLDEAAGTLMKCRKDTGSKPTTSPDPCKPGVADMISIAINSVGSVKSALDAAK